MAIQDNSPNRGSIRWSGINLIRGGFTYSIKDGETKRRYVYWSAKNPYVFETSDNLPYNHDEIIFLNNNGMCTVYPSDRFFINDSYMDFINNHINNKDIHLYDYNKDLLNNILSLEKTIRLLTEDRNDLYKICRDLQSQIDTLRGGSL